MDLSLISALALSVGEWVVHNLNIVIPSVLAVPGYVGWLHAPLWRATRWTARTGWLLVTAPVRLPYRWLRPVPVPEAPFIPGPLCKAILTALEAPSVERVPWKAPRLGAAEFVGQALHAGNIVVWIDNGLHVQTHSPNEPTLDVAGYLNQRECDFVLTSVRDTFERMLHADRIMIEQAALRSIQGGTTSHAASTARIVFDPPEKKGA